VIPVTGGGVNVPLETVSVAVIVVVGSESDRKLSHVVAARALTGAAVAAANTSPKIARVIVKADILTLDSDQSKKPQSQ
jgi:hypothetical protein